MPKSGSQVILCDLPIRYDPYVGCSHGCEYCFANHKRNIEDVQKLEGVISITNFINGLRCVETNWCDFDIPIHIGGCSDPLQSVENKYRVTYNSLIALRDANYPFVISSKGFLLWDDCYLAILKDCNCVIQISMCDPLYDDIEKGAPTFKERKNALQKIFDVTKKRIIIRVQPYIPNFLSNLLLNLVDYKKYGVYGITIEAIKLKNKKNRFVKFFGDYVLPVSILKHDFQKIKNKCHEVGLRFYCAENRLRSMGDDLCCCGIDGMGWKANKCNLNHYLLDVENFSYTEKMKQIGTATLFKAFSQKTISSRAIASKSYKQCMDFFINSEKYKKIIG